MKMRDDKYRQVLENMVSSKVLYNEPAERHTSIGVGGRTDALVYPHSRDELRQVISYLRNCEIPFIPVGNWTNIIVKDGGYRGVIVSLKCLNHVTWKEQDAGHVSIYAEAGVAISDIVRLSAGESLTGIEFCAGIPGSVGGAVRMNAGAYGNEIKDVIESVSIMNISGIISEFKGTELTFEYRNLVLQDGAIIVSASFLLTKGIKENIQKRIQEIIEIRKKKHPLEYRNAGSIFKNPKGLPAGQIIDELKLRGIQIGGAKISEKHGNFIVNTGGAKAGDILALIDTVQKKVWEERGIRLEPEIIVIGEDE
jgi:UDP-N-acetylmuramate dehydrogenase